jgi:hypothetical protein
MPKECYQELIAKAFPSEIREGKAWYKQAHKEVIMKRVAIVIQGGCFVSAWAQDETLEVEVWDFDNIVEEDGRTLKELETDFKAEMEENNMVSIA